MKLFVDAAATCPSGSSSSLSVTLSLHLRSMEPSGHESSEGGTHIRCQGFRNLKHNGLNTLKRGKVTTVPVGHSQEYVRQ